MKLQKTILQAAASVLLICSVASVAKAETRHGMAPSRQMMHHRMHRTPMMHGPMYRHHMKRQRMMRHRMMRHRMMRDKMM